MNVHIIQHVDFEKPGLIEDWANENNHIISFTHLYKNQLSPDLNNFDLLIIMGGPMGVYDFDKYPWISKELDFIRKCVEKNKAILGICLGAQLLASALGARVYEGPNKEIGWLPVSWKKSPINNIPDQHNVFHWHGDTFDIPNGATHLASSKGVPNQAFIYNNNVIGLQFHLEVNSQSVDLMLKNCIDDLTDGKYVQSIEEIKNGSSFSQINKEYLWSILNYLSDRIN
jgi:GMP synthase-like glutamine amidotransferase